jgi:hypothetical protein
MAFTWKGKQILFNDRSPDWKFIETISYRLDVGTDTEYTVEKWEHIPSNTEHKRQLTTKHYNKAVVHRRQIKPFGRMRMNEDPSKYTTLGEEVFMEWNPAVFLYSNKLRKHCQKMLADPSLIREPIIFNTEYRTVQPAVIDDELDMTLIQQVNDLYRPDTNAHINFMHRPEKRAVVNPLKATWGIRKSDEELTSQGRTQSMSGSGPSGTFVPRHQRSGPEEATVKLTELGDTSESGPGDIAAFLRKYGITDFGKITIPKDRETGINRDMTFINFDTVEAANKAVSTLNGQRARFGYSCVKAMMAHQQS